MPTYEYRNSLTGQIEEHFRTIDRRDDVPYYLKRISVPQHIGYANNPSLKEPGVDEAVPKALREMELSGISAKKIETDTGFSVDHHRRVWNF